MDKFNASRRLLRHGLWVFLLGLGTGLVMVAGVPIFANPRLALAGHLVGVTNGMFLLLLGLVVEKVDLSPPSPGGYCLDSGIRCLWELGAAL